MKAKTKGLYQRYKIQHMDPADGPDDPNAVYFVLRLDNGRRDPIHIRACRIAALTYAKEIGDHLPKLRDDLVRVVLQQSKEDA